MKLKEIDIRLHYLIVESILKVKTIEALCLAIS